MEESFANGQCKLCRCCKLLVSITRLRKHFARDERRYAILDFTNVHVEQKDVSLLLVPLPALGRFVFDAPAKKQTSLLIRYYIFFSALDDFFYS